MPGPFATRTRRAALAATLGLHALVLLAGWRLATRPDPPGEAGDALQVIWIEPAAATSSPPPVAAVPAPIPVPTPPSTHTRRARTQVPVAPVPAQAPADAGTPAPAPSRPLSVVALAQVAAAEQAAAGHDFRRDPLRRPPPALEVAPERFRVASPMTPAAIAAGIGQLFGGAGYEASPCPRIRRNIAQWRTAGGSDAALAEELRRLQAHCL